MAQAVCPPVPSEAELRHSGNYVRINPVHVVLGEFLVMEYLGVISCIEIVRVNTNYATGITSQFTYRNNRGNTIGMRIDALNNNRGMLYRRNPNAESLDTFIEGRNIPSEIRDKILKDYLTEDDIGRGRRKQRKTKRTRKNKRKTRKHRKVRRL